LLSLFVFLSPSFTEASDTALEKDLQKRLEKSKRIISKAIEKLKGGSSIFDETAQLKATAEDVRTVDLLLQERFRLMDEEIKSKGPTARVRQGVMADGYRKALAEYLSLIDSLPPEGQNAEAVLENLRDLLDRTLKKKKKPIFGSLPYRNLYYPSREPSADPPIKPAYKGGNRTVSTDDLKNTAEAPISDTIANLAQSLNWNPISMYEYVKNTIETEWYWGCMKGAEETLRQKAGNDCDQATLLVALFRASGFPSRYVRGTMEFFAGGRDGSPIEKVKNLTGIDDPWKIAEYFQKAGVPYKTTLSGGTITNFQIEHIWVESQIPYANYRGAIIDEQGKMWLGLDTSIKVKGYTYNNPIDVYQQSGMSAQLSALMDQYLGAMHTETPLEYLEGKLSASSYQLSALMRTRTIIPEVMNILPASMQFNQIKITHEYTEIPDELKHKVRFITADTNSAELFSLILDTLKLSNQKITISYEPETVEDQQIIDSYGGLDNTPAYLVRLRPVLKVNGQRMVVGKDALPMGEEHTLQIELISPNGTETGTNTQITGNVVAIGIVSQKAVQQSTADIGSDAEALLFRETVTYIDRWNKAEEELASIMQLTLSRPMPTVVIVGGVIDVTCLLDIPHGFEWKGTFIDAPVRAVEIISPQSSLRRDAEGKRQATFMQLSALQGSILENRIFEDDFRVDSISTAKLFEVANASHTPVLSIDKANISSLFPALSFDEAIKQDIANAVNQNLTVRMPQTEMSYADWTGVGYLKENPLTGEAGYMLTGMIAGGMTAVSPNKWLSGDLKSTLNRPYSTNFAIRPLMVAIIFPYDGAALSGSLIDVEGIVSDPAATVNVNGVRASVSNNGRFAAKGVSLSTGTNRITAVATSLLGKTDSQTISVNYQPSQISPMMLSITYPTAGASINRRTTVVRGTVTTDAKEISIKVNGIAADIYGNQFVINNVSLVDGDNVIIANALDSNGAVARAEVTVRGDTSKPYVTLSASITSGIPALMAYFSVATSIPNVITSYQIDFEGAGVIDYTGDNFENISHTYTTEGVYYPTVTVVDAQGNTYTDSIAITVLNKAEIDALLKGKWLKLKAALASGDIEGALVLFKERAKDKYRTIFNALKDQLPMILQTFIEFNIIDVYEIIAEYEIVANEDGILYSYPGVFIRGGDGIWKFNDF